MDSDNWVVSNLQGALDTWNEKMGEIVGLLTASPADFRGGGIWDAVLSIHGAVQAVALALLVLFFLSGLVKTCGSFAEAKRPEVVLKLFVRFVLAHAAVVYGLELMMAFLDVVQGLIGDMMDAAGFASAAPAALPGEMVEAIEDVDSRYATDWSAIKASIKADLSNYLYKKTKRNPMILPIIMEI